MPQYKLAGRPSGTHKFVMRVLREFQPTEDEGDISVRVSSGECSVTVDRSAFLMASNERQQAKLHHENEHKTYDHDDLVAKLKGLEPKELDRASVDLQGLGCYRKLTGRTFLMVNDIDPKA
jgi:hypothetical protein